MGKRGPPPTPTSVLKLRGSWRASRREGEPEASGSPSRPEWLTPAAAELWELVVPALEALGVLGASDGFALARYCALYAEWIECGEAIARQGTFIQERDKRGKLKPLRKNPRIALRQELGAELGRLEREFGLTPAARVGVRAETGKVPRGKSGLLKTS